MSKGDDIRAAAIEAARKYAEEKVGPVATAVAADPVLVGAAPGQFIATVRVTFTDGTEKQYEYRCQPDGGSGRVWPVAQE